MKVSKHQLKRIIREEKTRLLRETNPDGTISDAEAEDRAALMEEVEATIDELIQYINRQSDRIGGPYRGPGIRAQAMRILSTKIPRSR